MSIRILTTQLQRETTEHQRVQHFQSSRSVPGPKTQNNPAKQTPFLTGTGNRQTSPQQEPVEAPIQQASPKVGLKERSQQTTYGIPGGIAARFGRQSLKEPVAQPEQPKSVSPQEPLTKPVEDTQTTEPAQAQEQERATEQDDSARITIELQSH